MTWRSLLPWGVVAALLIALVLTCGDESPTPILSAETRKEIERVMGEAARTEFARLSDSLSDLSRASIDTSQLRAGNARSTRGRAGSVGRDADAHRLAMDLALSVRDSLKNITAAYEARTSERDTLQLAYDQLESAHLLAIRAAETATDRANQAVERLQALEVLNARILDDVAAAERGCRILGIVRCPTRKEAFIVGTIIGAGGAVVATVALR